MLAPVLTPIQRVEEQKTRLPENVEIQPKKGDLEFGELFKTDFFSLKMIVLLCSLMSYFYTLRFSFPSRLLTDRWMIARAGSSL